MYFCLLMLEIFCSAASPQGSIFAGDFDMWISYDRPAAPNIWNVTSTNGDSAAFVTSSSFLEDGKVAQPTRISWDTGSQDTSVNVHIIAGGIPGVSGLDIPANGLFVFALLCPKTDFSIPAGVSTTFRLTAAGGFFGKTVSATTVLLNNGSVAAIGIYDNTGFGGTYGVKNVTAQINNNLAGSTWATAGQNIDVGEFWFGNLVEFKTASDPVYGMNDATTNRRSHSNQTWPLYRKPYRTLSADLTVMNNSAAYTGTNNFDQVRQTLSQSTAALFIPRIYTPGTSTQNANDINQLAIYGRVDSIGPLKGLRDATGLWTSSIAVSEAPP